MLCPDCAGDWPVLTQLRAHYGDKISFILHTFPLPCVYRARARARDPNPPSASLQRPA